MGFSLNVSGSTTATTTTRAGPEVVYKARGVLEPLWARSVHFSAGPCNCRRPSAQWCAKEPSPMRKGAPVAVLFTLWLCIHMVSTILAQIGLINFLSRE